MKGKKGKMEKGMEFENQVAELYRLLGYDIIPNISICNKKVDILATINIPGSAEKHRIIVECKDERENRNQNQRVLEFKGLLDNARKLNQADSAEIITRKEWGASAKGAALESGVRLYTYSQKLSKLIIFDDYLNSLIQDFENDELSKYYIDLNANKRVVRETLNLSGKSLQKKEDEIFSPIDGYIDNWLKEETSKNRIAILGEYGLGKTSFCRHYVYELAKKYRENQGNNVRIPIFFELGKFTKNIEFEDLIVGYLDRKCEVSNPKFKTFKKMNDEGLFLLIFDGFDEMAMQVDFDTIEGNLKEIEKLTKSTKSKVLLTSRPEYFISAEEEKKIFAPTSLPEKERGFDKINLILLNKLQIKSFLQRRIPLIKEAEKDWRYYLEKIGEIHDLSDLANRPVMLDMITKTLPWLIKQKKTINAANLYQTYLEGEIKRQAIDKKRQLLIKREHRFVLMQILAMYLYQEKPTGVTAKEVKELIKDEFTSKQQEELEAHLRDFLTCSFLIREGDNYRFSHRSILEYLVAKWLAEEMKENNAPQVKISKAIRDFITEILSDYRPRRFEGSLPEGLVERDGKYFNLIDSKQMVFVPAGEFIMGGEDYDEKPIRIANLVKGFFMDVTPVTNSEYKKFVDVTCYKAPEHWKGGKIPEGKDEHPVCYVTWKDAVAYCKWAGKRLPKEEEWEKAARGIDGRIYPYGNEFDAGKCNTFESKRSDTTRVGNYPKGVSPYGCLDMSGNVWEWTDFWYDKKRFNPVLRGGSWDFLQVNVQCTYRNSLNPVSYYYVGFRSARTL